MPFVFFSPEKINKKWGPFLRGPAAVRRTKRPCRTRHFQQRTRIPQRAYKKERREALWKPRPTMPLLQHSAVENLVGWESARQTHRTVEERCLGATGPLSPFKGTPQWEGGEMPHHGRNSPLIASPNWTNWNLPFQNHFSVLCANTTGWDGCKTWVREGFYTFLYLCNQREEKFLWLFLRFFCSHCCDADLIF